MAKITKEIDCGNPFRDGLGPGEVVPIRKSTKDATCEDLIGPIAFDEVKADKEALPILKYNKRPIKKYWIDGNALHVIFADNLEHIEFTNIKLVNFQVSEDDCDITDIKYEVEPS